MRATGSIPRAPGCSRIPSQVVYHYCVWYLETIKYGAGERAVGMVELAAMFVVGFGAGYAIREIISRRRRRAAQSTFIYPE